jgi:hypothetical protein
MDNTFLDDFLLSDTDLNGISEIPDRFGPIDMKDIKQRYDVFRSKHRDDLDMNIMGVELTWEPPGRYLYDWYRSSSGMTVSLESPRSLSRPTGAPITIRVRHEDADLDPSITKLGKTLTFDEREPQLLEKVRREILDALCEWESSPLWRLRQNLDLPDFIVDVLDEPVDQFRSVGQLELRSTQAMLIAQLFEPTDLLDSLHVRESTYTRRAKNG